MDTRSKILTREQALQKASEMKRAGVRFQTIAGTFDVLRVDMVSDLERGRRKGLRTIALVDASGAHVLSPQARLELAAALQAIDYAVAVDGDAATFARQLAPDEHVSVEAQHRESTALLIERVLAAHDKLEQRRQAH